MGPAALAALTARPWPPIRAHPDRPQSRKEIGLFFRKKDKPKSDHGALKQDTEREESSALRRVLNPEPSPGTRTPIRGIVAVLLPDDKVVGWVASNSQIHGKKKLKNFHVLNFLKNNPWFCFVIITKIHCYIFFNFFFEEGAARWVWPDSRSHGNRPRTYGNSRAHRADKGAGH